MEEERPVIRLSHCQKEIFCLSVPEECPCCGEELRGSRLQEAPVSLPSPFSNGHKTSCSLLIIPTLSRDFDGTSDLHTGISNTTGVVYNYTKDGVRRDVIGWERCVSVPLVQPDMFHLLAQWDQYLDRFSEGPMWDPAWTRFDEEDHNCFKFCVEFVNVVLQVQGRGSVSKEELTRSFILPRMRRVTQYSSLTRQLRTDRLYVVDRQDRQTQE